MESDRNSEQGSALIMGVILLTVFALLASSLVDLTRDTVAGVKTGSYQRHASLIAESVLSKVKFDIHHKFEQYYVMPPNAQTTAKMDWYTDPGTGLTAIGSPDSASTKYTIPAAATSAYKEFVSTIKANPMSPQEWTDAQYDISIVLKGKNNEICTYEITCKAYFVDSTGTEIPGSASTIVDLTEFGYGESDVWDNLSYTSTSVTLKGDMWAYGDVKSDEDYHFVQNEAGQKPTMLGSVYAGGEIDGTAKNGNPISNSKNFFNTKSNVWYKNNLSNPKKDSSMARPFKPTAVTSYNRYTNGDKTRKVEYRWVTPSTGGGNSGSGSSSSGSGSF